MVKSRTEFASLLEDFDLHKNKEIKLNRVENPDFYSVAEIMSSKINDNIEFINVNLLNSSE